MNAQCRWCEGWMFTAKTGRPRLYCSGACRKADCLFREEVRSFLVRAGQLGEPDEFRRAAIAKVRSERVEFYQRGRRAKKKRSLARAVRFVTGRPTGNETQGA